MSRPATATSTKRVTEEVIVAKPKGTSTAEIVFGILALIFALLSVWLLIILNRKKNFCNTIKCAHGNCSCATGKCVCPEGWTGDLCDKPKV